MKQTRGATLLSQLQKPRAKFSASHIGPFGELTGALWRLPLTSVARTGDIVPGVVAHSAEPINTVPTPLRQRLLSAGIQGGKIEEKPIKRDKYGHGRTVRSPTHFEAIEERGA